MLQAPAGHGLIGLIEKAREGAALLEFTNDALEFETSADLPGIPVFRRHDDGRIREVNLDFHALASRNRRNESKFASGAERRIPCGIFLVERDTHMIDGDAGCDAMNERARRVSGFARHDTARKAECVASLGEGEKRDFHSRTNEARLARLAKHFLEVSATVTMTAPAMISLAEAHHFFATKARPLPGIHVPLASARGAVLAECVVADKAYPPGDRSMMDGYAIGENEAPGAFRVAGEIQAGAVVERTLQRGECYRVFTGALLPPGVSRVVMQEDVQRTGDTVSITAFAERCFIRREGSEAQPGDIILHAGTKLGGAELAMLAQVGTVRPKVVRKPVVRHIATGGEIVPPEQIPAPGQIRDTNSTLLRALLEDLGVETIHPHRAMDDLEELAACGSEPCDLLLLSGGASVGSYDFGAEALRRLGFEIHFDRVNLRPGKPLTFATRDGQAAFVIPGNPVSHFVCFHVAIRFVVERMMGNAAGWNPVRLAIRGGEPLRPDPRETFWPARAFVEEGVLAVAPKRWATSEDTFSLAGTNALVRVHENSPANGLVETLLLDAPGGA
jgi:molybdopterin molybdotransferase